jgi:hypothetical protein
MRRKVTFFLFFFIFTLVSSTNVFNETTQCFGKNATDPQVCSGFGICTSPNNCTCNQGHTGENCQFIICFEFDSSNPKVCSGHGNCSKPNHCDCNQGYIGMDCKFPICFGFNSTVPGICGPFGKCSKPNFCECEAGYSGFRCEFTQCHGVNSTNTTNVCSNQGNCTTFDVCTCNHGFYGRICQFEIYYDVVLYGFAIAVIVSLSIVSGFVLISPFLILFQKIIRLIKRRFQSTHEILREEEALFQK